MSIAILVFSYGILRFKIQDYNHQPLSFCKLVFAFLLLLGLWSLSFYILSYPQLANLMFGLVVLFSVSYILYSVNQETANQARKTLVIGLLCLISVMFWAFYFQMFMSFTLFIVRTVEPTLFGIHFPPPYYVTIQSIGMLVIGYFLSKINPHLTLIERGLSTGKKFLLSMFLITLSYLLIALIARYSHNTLLLSPLFIIPAYLIISAAELLLSPVGISAVTVLSDRNKVSTMMGIFFVSLGIGGFLSGKLSNLTAIPEGETNVLVLKELYANAFMQQLGILVIATLGCLFIYALIKFLLTHVKTEES